LLVVQGCPTPGWGEAIRMFTQPGPSHLAINCKSQLWQPHGACLLYQRPYRMTGLDPSGPPLQCQMASRGPTPVIAWTQLQLSQEGEQRTIGLWPLFAA